MSRILLLEPDRQLASNTRAYFKQAGHELTHYSDPQAAVIFADAQLPDIIILDLFLASHSGIEFLYELRSYPEWQNIPVIITGQLNSEELDSFAESFKELKINKYLPKSSSPLRDYLAAVETSLQPA